MRHCMKGRCQVDGHTHRAVKWFPLVEACLDVCCELQEGRCVVECPGLKPCLSGAGERNSLIKGKMSALAAI